MAESSRDEIAKLEALYANNPEGRVFTHLAEAYRKAGELDRARGILDEGLTRHASYASAHVVLGRVLMDQQKSEEAAEAFSRVLALDPHNMVALRSLGEMARVRGDNAQALVYFDELRHLDPNSDDIAQILEGLKNAINFAAEPPAAAAAPEPAPEPATEAPVAAAPEPEPEPELQQQDLAAEAETALESMETGWMPEPDEMDSPLPGDLADFAAFAGAEQSIDLSGTELEEPSDETPFVVSFGADEPEAVEQPFQMGDFALGGEPATDQPSNRPTEPEAPTEVESAFTPPAAEAPVNMSPADSDIDELFLDEPIADEPEPFAKQPVAEEPVLDEAAFDDPFTDEPFANESVTDDPPADEATGEVVTETIAELYRSQQLYDRAAEVYRALLLQRPSDVLLQGRLAEVEALARSGVPEVEPAAVESAPWIVGAAAAAQSAPSPYAWSEQNPETAADDAPPITAYFQTLLTWRPSQPARSAEAAPSAEPFLAPPAPEPEPALFETAVAPPADEEPFMLLEESVTETDAFYTVDDAADDPFAGLPAPPMDEPEMAEPAPAAPPTPEALPEPPRRAPPRPVESLGGDSTTPEGAFDEWFGPPEPTEDAAPAGPASPAEEEAATGDDDDDLEMFRSWLQSLKK